MLKLIYFYYDSLRGFENPEFNFSSKYRIHLEGETLSIGVGDKNHIDGFYANVDADGTFDNRYEINAVVGNNGAGKSSLLKNIRST